LKKCETNTTTYYPFNYLLWCKCPNEKIQTQWLEYKKFDSITVHKMNQHVASVNLKHQELENYKTRMALLDSSGLLSENEKDLIRENILIETNELMNLTQKKVQIEMEINTMSIDLLEKLNTLTKAYCLKYKIDVLMSYSDFTPWNYIRKNIKLKNINSDFISYLNSN
jgi:hypothetical protein